MALLFNYKFDGCSGDILHEASGQDDLIWTPWGGTTQQSPLWDSGDAPRAGVCSVDNSLYGGGDWNYLDGGGFVEQGSSHFIRNQFNGKSCVSSFAFWAKMTTGPSGHGWSNILCIAVPGTNSEELILALASGAPGLLYGFKNNNGMNYINTWNDSVSIFDQDTWTHIAVTHDGDTVRFYKNKALVLTKTSQNYSGTFSIIDEVATLGAGYNESGNPGRLNEPFAGKWGEFLAFDHALTQSEIATIYDTGAIEIIAQGENASASSAIVLGSATQKHSGSSSPAFSNPTISAGAALPQEHVLSGGGATSSSSISAGASLHQEHQASGANAAATGSTSAAPASQRHTTTGSAALAAPAIATGEAGQHYIISGVPATAASSAATEGAQQQHHTSAPSPSSSMTALVGEGVQLHAALGYSVFAPVFADTPPASQDHKTKGAPASSSAQAASGSGQQQHIMSDGGISASASAQPGAAKQNAIITSEGVSATIAASTASAAVTHSAASDGAASALSVDSSSIHEQRHEASGGNINAALTIAVEKVVERHVIAGHDIASSAAIQSGGAAQSHGISGASVYSSISSSSGVPEVTHAALAAETFAATEIMTGGIQQQHDASSSYTGALLYTTRKDADFHEFLHLGANHGEFSEKTAIVAYDLFAVDTKRKYRLSVLLRQRSASGGEGNPSARHFVGMVCRDSDGKHILPRNYYAPNQSTKTRLAKPLNYGDAEVFLESSDGWVTDGPFHLAAFGYQDYADYYYTRDTIYLGNGSSIDGNKIILSSPWYGAAKPAGTAVANTRDHSSYQYSLLYYSPAPNNWQRFERIISGEADSGEVNRSKFRPATATISMVILANYNSPENNVLEWSQYIMAEEWIEPARQNHQASGETLTTELSLTGGAAGQDQIAGGSHPVALSGISDGVIGQFHETLSGDNAAFPAIAISGSAAQDQIIIGGPSGAIISALGGGTAQDHLASADEITASTIIGDGEMFSGALLEADSVLSSQVSATTGGARANHKATADGVVTGASASKGGIQQRHDVSGSGANYPPEIHSDAATQHQIVSSSGSNDLIDASSVMYFEARQSHAIQSGGQIEAAPQADAKPVAQEHIAIGSAIEATATILLADAGQSHTAIAAPMWAAASVSDGSIIHLASTAASSPSALTEITDAAAEQQHMPDASNVFRDSSVESGSAGQSHTPASGGSVGATMAVTSGIVEQDHMAGPAGATFGAAAGTGGVWQQHTATAAPAEAATTINAAAPEQWHRMGGDEILSVLSATSGAASQHAQSIADHIESTLAASSGWVLQGHKAITMSSLTSGEEVEAGGAIQEHETSADSAIPAATAGGGLVTQHHHPAGLSIGSEYVIESATILQNHQSGALFLVSSLDTDGILALVQIHTMDGEIVSSVQQLQDGELIQLHEPSPATASALSIIHGGSISVGAKLEADSAASASIDASTGSAEQLHSVAGIGAFGGTIIATVKVQQVREGRVISVTPIYSVLSASSTTAGRNAVTRPG